MFNLGAPVLMHFVITSNMVDMVRKHVINVHAKTYVYAALPKPWRPDPPFQSPLDVQAVRLKMLIHVMSTMFPTSSLSVAQAMRLEDFSSGTVKLETSRSIEGCTLFTVCCVLSFTNVTTVVLDGITNDEIAKVFHGSQLTHVELRECGMDADVFERSVFSLQYTIQKNIESQLPTAGIQTFIVTGGSGNVFAKVNLGDLFSVKSFPKGLTVLELTSMGLTVEALEHILRFCVSHTPAIRIILDNNPAFGATARDKATSQGLLAAHIMNNNCLSYLSVKKCNLTCDEDITM
eukprot:PhF_6_TR17045/c2_g1_i2/m.25954